MLTTRRSSNRSSFLPPELHRPLLAGACVFVASWLFVSFLPKFHIWLYGDVRFYETWGGFIANHLVPYRDFRIEYPPGALPMFLGPVYLRKFSGYQGTYFFWFRVEILVVGLLMLVAMAWALHHLGASRRRAYAALCLAGLLPALLGPIALSRFDYLPALFSVAAVAALVARRPIVACAFASLGVVVKVYPAVLIPLALIELWRRGGRRAVAEGVGISIAVVAALTVPLAIAGREGISWALHRQVHRPLQVEALGAVLIAAWHKIAGGHLHAVKAAGSDNLVGPAAHIASTLSGVVTVVAILAVYALYARSGRTREELVTASAAAVVAYIAFSKVLSPQYLVWLFPLVPLVGGRRGVRACVLLVVVTSMTQIWEPWRFGDYFRHFTPWITWLIVARDLLIVALLAVLIRPSGRDADELDRARPAVV
jgi:Glycosyltransferase family 87